MITKVLESWLTNQSLVGVEPGLMERVRFYQRQIPGNIQVLVADTDPFNLIAVFLACLDAQTSVFLANPDWKKAEWQKLEGVLNPDLVLGNVPSITWQGKKQTLDSVYIFIPTGGTSGKIKFAAHTWQTLGASVQGFLSYFELKEVNSFCILPLYHVSGFMQFLRSFLSGGKFYYTDYHALKKKLPLEDFQGWFISLVPTQLQYLLDQHPVWLRQFQTVLLGGAPAGASLLAQARKEQIPLAPTYGMTETAAQIATLKPGSFLQAQAGNGKILPHAQVSIIDDKGEPVAPGETGLISIQSQSLFHGYYPEINPLCEFMPGDLGYFDRQGNLQILGRQSQCIITGGEKVFPAEVEAVLGASGQISDVVVLGLPDRRWGERVVAVYVSVTNANLDQSLADYLKQRLARYKCPKQWISVPTIRRSPAGKVDYNALKTWLLSEWGET